MKKLTDLGQVLFYWCAAFALLGVGAYLFVIATLLIPIGY